MTVRLPLPICCRSRLCILQARPQENEVRAVLQVYQASFDSINGA